MLIKDRWDLLRPVSHIRTEYPTATVQRPHSFHPETCVRSTCKRWLMRHLPVRLCRIASDKSDRPPTYSGPVAWLDACFQLHNPDRPHGYKYLGHPRNLSMSLQGCPLTETTFHCSALAQGTLQTQRPNRDDKFLLDDRRHRNDIMALCWPRWNWDILNSFACLRPRLLSPFVHANFGDGKPTSLLHTGMTFTLVARSSMHGSSSEYT